MNGVAMKLAALEQPEQTMIDVGGRRLAVWVQGQGSPTVVLETGLGAESSEWRRVQNAISAITRVVRYDRAGRGSSDVAPRPRHAGDMADDLHAMLGRAGVKDPHVLVGHSFGGLLTRLYAHKHRARVAGLVLVDAMHEDQFHVFGPLFPARSPADGEALRDMRAFWTAGWRDPAATPEGIDFVTSIALAREVLPMGDMPIRVLTAGTFLNQPMLGLKRRHELQRRWDDLQDTFLRLSTRADRVVVESSGHFMQRDRPDVVTAAIRHIVVEVRRQSARMGRQIVMPGTAVKQMCDVVALMAIACCMQAGAADTKASGGTPLDWARVLVADVTPENTSYQHRQGYVVWKGTDGATEYKSHTDCSGFIDALYEKAYGIDRDEFRRWLGKPRPFAITYHDAIVARNGFASITDVSDIRAGDVIAIRYPDGSENTGHVMLVADAPRRRVASKPFVPETQQLEVDVIDSSESGHGKLDTRRRSNGTFEQGVGRGTLRLYADAAGHIAGYAWSTFANSDYYDRSQRDLVVGRLERKAPLVPHH